MNQSIDIFMIYKKNLINFSQKHLLLGIYKNGEKEKKIFDWLQFVGISSIEFLDEEAFKHCLTAIKKGNNTVEKKYGIIVSAEFKNDISMDDKEPLDVFVVTDEIYSLFCRYFPLNIRIEKVLNNLRWKGDDKPLKKMDKWKRILIIRLDAIGDLIMMTPFIRELRRNCPNAHITLVISRINEILFRNCPYISELVLYDLPNSYGGENLDNIETICQKVELFSKINLEGNYDVAFQPCEILHGRKCIESLMLLLAINTQSRIVRLHTFSKHQDLHYMLFQLIKDKFSLISYDIEEKHEVLYLLDMIKAAGGIVKKTEMELWVNETCNQFMDRCLLTKKHKSIFVAIGIIGSIPCKNWPAENYFKLIHKSLSFFNKIHFIILGGTDAQGAAKLVTQNLNKEEMTCVTDLTGATNLVEASEIIGKCDVYIGSNTGLMHMAGAMGIPIVEISPALLNSTISEGAHPVRMGPWGVEYVSLRPHGIGNCRIVCKEKIPHCTTQISVEDVIKAAINLCFNHIFQRYMLEKE